MVSKSPLKQRPCLFRRRPAGGCHSDEITAEPVRDRQGFRPRPIAQANPALVVHPPHVIGMLRYRQLPEPRRCAATHSSTTHEPGPLQDIARSRSRRPADFGMILGEFRDDLARSPSRTQPPHPTLFSRQGIGRSSRPQENCHPSFRSVSLPFYPSRTARHLLPQREKGVHIFG
jgi:hypothetical protein